MGESLFLTNVCSFKSCGLHFADLYDLIGHVEEVHTGPDAPRDEGHGNLNAPMSTIAPYFLCPREPRPRPIKPEPITCSFANRKPSPYYGQVNALLHAQHEQQQAAAMGGDRGSSSAIMNALHSHGKAPARPRALNVPHHDSVEDDVASVQSTGGQSEEGNSTERAHPCPQCPKRYKAYAGLRFHVKNAHGLEALALLSQPTRQAPAPRPFKCNKCNKAYKNQSGLTNHVTASHSARTVDSAGHTSMTHVGMTGGSAGKPSIVPPNRTAPVSQSSSLAAKLVATSTVASSHQQKLFAQHKMVQPGYCNLSTDSARSTAAQHSPTAQTATSYAHRTTSPATATMIQQKYAQPTSSMTKQRYVGSGGVTSSGGRQFANVVKHVSRPPPTIVTSNVGGQQPPGQSADTVAFE